MVLRRHVSFSPVPPFVGATEGGGLASTCFGSRNAQPRGCRRARRQTGRFTPTLVSALSNEKASSFMRNDDRVARLEGEHTEPEGVPDNFRVG